MESQRHWEFKIYFLLLTNQGLILKNFKDLRILIATGYIFGDWLLVHVNPLILYNTN